MASNQKGKQSFRPTRLSHLRQEIRAEESHDGCAGGEAEVQVPNSQAVIPETQLDSLDPTIHSDRHEDVRLTSGTRDPGNSTEYDNAFLSRVEISKKATRPDPIFTVNLLQRPEEPNESSFSPYVNPKCTTNTAQNEPASAASYNAIVSEQAHLSSVRDSGPRVDEAAPVCGEYDQYHGAIVSLIYPEESEGSQYLPNTSILSTDEQGLPVVTTQLVPPGIDEGGALRLASSNTINSQPDARFSYVDHNEKSQVSCTPD